MTPSRVSQSVLKPLVNRVKRRKPMRIVRFDQLDMRRARTVQVGVARDCGNVDVGYFRWAVASFPVNWLAEYLDDLGEVLGATERHGDGCPIAHCEDRSTSERRIQIMIALRWRTSPRIRTARE